MSHPEQRAFFALVSSANADLISDGRILEIGSYDVNGSVRDLFRGCREYVGVDLAEGPGVDRVGYGHTIDDPDGAYDLTLSGECFEHDPHWSETFVNMIRLTRPGGLVTFTCASRGRPEHGTRRTLASESPGTEAEGLDYYRNLSPEDFRQLGLAETFSEWRFWYLPTSFDLYFAGVRSGSKGTLACLPADSDVRRIQDLMSLPNRAFRWPLRPALWMTGGGPSYQRLVLLYWRFAQQAIYWSEQIARRVRTPDVGGSP